MTGIASRNRVETDKNKETQRPSSVNIPIPISHGTFTPQSTVTETAGPTVS